MFAVTDVTKGITTFLGWLTGIAALAYATGLGIYGLRLSVNRVPNGVTTASSLPGNDHARGEVR